MLETIIESFCIFLAVTVGIYYYHYLNRFYRIFFLQVAIYLIVYIAARSFLSLNHFIYNLGTFIEISLLMRAACVYFKDKRMRLMISALYACYFFVYIYCILLVTGPFSFAYWSYVCGGIGITVIYLIALYNTFLSALPVQEKRANTYLFLGLIIYFACNIPNLCMTGYLNDHLTEMGREIFNLLLNASANIRYILVAYTFWQLQRTPKHPATLVQ